MHNENVTQEHKKHGNIRICFAEILVQLLGAGLDNLSVLLLPLGGKCDGFHKHREGLLLIERAN